MRFHLSTTSASLTGQVSSKEEGPMEGVLVSAKRLASTVTVTVVLSSAWGASLCAEGDLIWDRSEAVQS